MAHDSDSNSSSTTPDDDYQSHLQAGNALVAQAQTVATTDFAQARALWQEAGKQYYLAHKADRDEPEAAFKLAQAWMAEAHALQKEGSPNAKIMWSNAAAQAELAFDLTPENGRLAMAVATCYHFGEQPEEAEAWQQLGRHLLDGAAKLQGHGEDRKNEDSED
ncbi:hypothetical protein [Diaphorobacter caeni]|uniref:hypothetical protein n=1 Tax=Diaphorobacter caeni TaxID=2784387 RepID=UPI00188F9538|nr:hypothetical protein [Diaphorobacter caeni]MBF5002754.1 hypothetical protein [Diaphorobacter caeni]